jgi:hypothetical protein
MYTGLKSDDGPIPQNVPGPFAPSPIYSSKFGPKCVFEPTKTAQLKKY